MAKCGRCQADTQISHLGDPICLKCADELAEALRNSETQQTSVGEEDRIRRILKADVAAAHSKARLLLVVLREITDNVPSGLPQPDGTPNIQNASQAYRQASEELVIAMRRLHAYLTDGIIPDDVKESVSSAKAV